MSTATDMIVVNVPVRTAYNQWTQMESYPEFMLGVESVKQIDDTHLTWKMNVAGVEREFDVTITDQQPDQHIAWTSHGEVQQSGRVDFLKISDDSTQVTLELDWDPTGVAETIAKAFQTDDALVKRNLEQFKELIEDHGHAEGAWRGEVKDGDVKDETPDTGVKSPGVF